MKHDQLIGLITAEIDCYINGGEFDVEGLAAKIEALYAA